MSERNPRFHLSLSVTESHFDAMVGFYSTLFGSEPSKRKSGYAKFEPSEPWVNLTLNAVPRIERSEVDHLGIQVWSDEMLDVARLRLLRAGIPIRDESNVECCYAGQNKFWVTDPEGRNVEFFHVLRDVDHHGRTSEASATASGACCAPAEKLGSACCTPAQRARQSSVTGCC